MSHLITEDPIILDGYILEDSFTSDATQNPTGNATDVPTVVSYGINKDSPRGLISYVDGEFIINKSGYYGIKSRLRVARDSNPGICIVFLWAEISTDSGSTWSILGNSADIKLNTSDELTIFFDFAPIYIKKGVRLRSMFARDSSENNSGSLIAGIPSTALSNYGLTTSPSAQLTFYANVI